MKIEQKCEQHIREIQRRFVQSAKNIEKKSEQNAKKTWEKFKCAFADSEDLQKCD